MAYGVGPGKPGAAMDGAFGRWAEPSGEDKTHPWGSDLSRPELCKLWSKVCGSWPGLGWPMGEAARLLGTGGESWETGSRVHTNPGPTQGQEWGQGSELLWSLHPSPWEDAFKAKHYPQGWEWSKWVLFALLIFSKNNEEGKAHPAGGTKIWAHSQQYSDTLTWLRNTHGHPFMTTSSPSSALPGVPSVCINVSQSDLPKTPLPQP